MNEEDLLLLEERIERQPYDDDAWIHLMDHARTLPMNKASDYYERFFRYYPTNGHYRFRQVQHLFEAVEAVEQGQTQYHQQAMDILNNIQSYMHLGLCNMYIDLIKRQGENEGEDHFPFIYEGYQFCLKHIGTDVKAGPLWLAFFQSCSDHSANVMRAQFYKALQIPHTQLDAIYELYEAWEMEQELFDEDALTKRLNEIKTKMEAAKTLCSKKLALRDKILDYPLAKPYCGSYEENAQHTYWLQYMDLEFSLTYVDEDGKRYVNEHGIDEQTHCFCTQLLNVFRHYPDMYFYVSLKFSSIHYIEKGLLILSDSLLLHFIYIQQLLVEGTKEGITKAKTHFDTLKQTNHDPLFFVNYLKFLWNHVSEKDMRDFFVHHVQSADVSYYVYLVAAQLEANVAYQGLQKEIPLRIFQAGLNHHGNSLSFVSRYLQFLKKNTGLVDASLSDIFEQLVRKHASECSEFNKELLEFNLHQLPPISTHADDYINFARYHNLKPLPHIGYIAALNFFYSFQDLSPATTQEYAIFKDTPRSTTPSQPIIYPNLIKMHQLKPKEIASITLHIKKKVMPPIFTELLSKVQFPNMKPNYPSMDLLNQSLTHSQARSFSSAFPNQPNNPAHARRRY